MPFIEWIGTDVPTSLARAIKAHNVSPADYSDLENVWGNDFEAIERDIKRYSPKGSFSVFEFHNRRPLPGVAPTWTTAEPGSLMDTHGIAYNRESYFR